jgi:hypothetical protein
MGMTTKKNIVSFHDSVGIEATEELLDWLRKHPKGKVNLAACTHLHTALLQVLLAARIPVAAWPDDQGLKSWLTAAINI